MSGLLLPCCPSTWDALSLDSHRTGPLTASRSLLKSHILSEPLPGVYLSNFSLPPGIPIPHSLLYFSFLNTSHFENTSHFTYCILATVCLPHKNESSTRITSFYLFILLITIPPVPVPKVCLAESPPKVSIGGMKIKQMN